MYITDLLIKHNYIYTMGIIIQNIGYEEDAPLKPFVSNYEYVCRTWTKLIRPSGVPMYCQGEWCK